MIPSNAVGFSIWSDKEYISVSCNANADYLVFLFQIAISRVPQFKEAIEKITKKPDLEFTKTLNKKDQNPIMEWIKEVK